MAAVARLNLKTLLPACVHLARRAGHAIKLVHKEGQLGAHNKKVEGDERSAQAMDAAEVLTIADLRSQDIIVKSLRGMFPGIRMVGEEDESEGKAGSPQEPSLLEDVQPLPSSFEVPSTLAESLTLGDTCLWIDPLDGTIEFVRNNLHNVCVLIGIAVNDRPVAGVIHQPFVGGDDGTVTYGAVGVGVFGDMSPAFGNPTEEAIVAMEEKTSSTPFFAKATARLGVNPAKISQGAGQNLLKLIRGETSVFVQRSGASRWDTCAAEALIMAIGGKVTDAYGHAYAYTEGAPSYVNAEGLIAARTDQLHSRVEQVFTEQRACDEDGDEGPQKKRARGTNESAES